MVFHENINISLFQTIGNWFSDIMIKFIQTLSSLGVNLTLTQGKILSLLIVSIGGYLLVKVLEKPIKWIMAVLSIILAISILSTFIS